MPCLSQLLRSSASTSRPSGAFGHLAVGGLGVPEAEAVVVLGEEQDVAHAGFLGRAGPLVGVAAGGLEEAHVLDARRPFLAGERAERPADEHAPLQGLEFLGPLGHVHGFRRARSGKIVDATTDAHRTMRTALIVFLPVSRAAVSGSDARWSSFVPRPLTTWDPRRAASRRAVRESSGSPPARSRGAR